MTAPSASTTSGPRFISVLWGISYARLAATRYWTRSAPHALSKLPSSAALGWNMLSNQSHFLAPMPSMDAERVTPTVKKNDMSKCAHMPHASAQRPTAALRGQYPSSWTISPSITCLHIPLRSDRACVCYSLQVWHVDLR